MAQPLQYLAKMQYQDIFFFIWSRCLFTVGYRPSSVATDAKITFPKRKRRGIYKSTAGVASEAGNWYLSNFYSTQQALFITDKFW